MKKIVSLAIVLMLVLSACAMAETLKLGTNVAFPPYEFYSDETNEPTGIDIEIAKLVCEKIGYDMEVVDMDFSAVIPALTTGKIDFSFAGMTVTEERKQSVDFTVSYATGVQSIIVPEGSAITTVDDLFAEGAFTKIGVQEATTGDLYTTWDLEDNGMAEINRFKTGADAVLALTSGKVDCVVIDNEPAKAFVAANEGLVILDTEYILEEYAAAFPKDSEIYPIFNAALEELIADGTVQSVIDTFITAE